MATAGRKGGGEQPTDDNQYIKLYMNPAQWLAYHFNARIMVVQAGRATGKTDFIITPRLVRVSESLPRGVSAFVGATLGQIATKTLPGVISAIERTTPYRNGQHFTIGQPPKNLGFEKPLMRPREWSNILQFYNGHIWHCVSISVTGSANGNNFVSIIGDEAKFYDGNKFKEEVFPTLRGLTYDHPAYSPNNPFYNSMLLVSDAPVTARQAWMQDYEKNQTYTINKEIIRMLKDFQIAQQYGVDLSDEEFAPKFLKKLKFLQARSTAFFNFSTLENADILTDRYFKDMQMNLSDFIFRTSILNQRVNKVDGCYYFFFDPDGMHGYLPTESSQMTVLENQMTTVHKNVYDKKSGRNIEIAYDTIDFDRISKRRQITHEERAMGLVSDDFEKLDCRFDTDIRPDLPLRIAFDWNKGVCGIVTGQTYPVAAVDCINVLSSMYVKDRGKRIRALCRQWADYYEPQRQQCNKVIHYYDSTANQGANYADDNWEKTRFCNIVYEELTARGWDVQNVDTGQPMPHYLKYQFMEDFLTGKTRFHLRMNTENCADLIIAMKATAKIIGKNGPMKNKSGEKRNTETGELVLQTIAADKGAEKKEVVDDVKQYRTDITDAFDELIIGCHKRDFIFSEVFEPLFG